MGRTLDEMLESLKPEQREAVERRAEELIAEELPSQELDRLWLEEANRRATQLDAGEVELVSGEEVDRKARGAL
jgi:hypothetical protein